jgi:hypothetical protein
MSIVAKEFSRNLANGTKAGEQVEDFTEHSLQGQRRIVSTELKRKFPPNRLARRWSIMSINHNLWTSSFEQWLR